MRTILPISIGAGLASAVLFLSTATGSSLAMVLLFLVVLPSFIAGLGWGNNAAIIAVLTASAVVAALLGPASGGIYLATLGAPVVILTYLALLAREAPAERPGGTAVVEWYPPGRLIAWSTVLGGVAAAMAIPALGLDAETYRNTARAYFNNAFFGQGSEGAPAGPDKEQLDNIVSLFVVILPASSAMVWMGVMLGNLWTAQKVLETSGRAIRPTPTLVTITYPARFPLGFVASLAGTFLPGLGGIVATGFAGAFLAAYVLMGLAVCHVVARQYAFAGLILSVLYMAMIFIGWIALFVAIVGLGEPLMRIRERTLGNSPPPHGPGG